MKKYSCGVGLMVGLLSTACLSESTFGQGFSRSITRSSSSVSGNGAGNSGQGDNRYGNESPGNGANVQQRSSSSVSANRSVSFTKNGKRFSITENASGITVSQDGHAVRARDADELKKNFPDAYRLYSDNIGAAQASGSASGSAGGSAGGFNGGFANNNRQGNQRNHHAASQNRSISLIDNGRKVSIAENAKGITVTVNGKTIRARNAADLKKRNLEAFNLYQEHLAGPNVGQGGVNAKELLRAELNKMRDENANNPAVRGLFEQMLREVNK